MVPYDATLSYVKYDTESVERQNAQRIGAEVTLQYLPILPLGPGNGESLVANLRSLCDKLPDGRAKLLAQEKLVELASCYDEAKFYGAETRRLVEEYYMWTGKAIRDGQIARTGKVDEIEVRA